MIQQVAKAFLIVGILPLSAGCAVLRGIESKLGVAGQPRLVLAAREVPDEPYHLQVGDKLDIFIWAEKGSAHRVYVREDGSIHFPPIGKIPAVGSSLQDLEDDLQERWNRRRRQLARPEAPPLTGPSSRKTLSPAEALNHAYLLRSGDKLEVSVYGHEDLRTTASLREDGSFAFPLIGSVQAKNRSLPEIEEEVRQRLDKDYLIDPQVTAQLVGAEFSIIWEGVKSGSFPLGSGMDLLTAISQVGDITASGSNRAEILREINSEELVIQVHIGQVLLGKAPNLPILPRDTIYVKSPPKRLEEKQITIQLVEATFTALGDVGRPGPLAIDGPTDLLTALSLAGGITKFGSNKIEIMRRVGDLQLVIRANVERILQGQDPNIKVHPRDTLYVRRRLF